MTDYEFCLENYIICDDHYLAIATEGAKLSEFIDRAKNFVRKLILQINMFIAEKINKIEKFLYYKPWWQAMTELTKSKVVNLGNPDSTKHYWFSESKFPNQISKAYEDWTTYIKARADRKVDEEKKTETTHLTSRKPMDDGVYMGHEVRYDAKTDDQDLHPNFIAVPVGGVKKILAQFVALLKNIHNNLTKYKPDVGGDDTANNISNLYHKSHDVNQVFQLFMQGTNRAIAMSRKMKYNSDLYAAKKIKEKKGKKEKNAEPTSDSSDS